MYYMNFFQKKQPYRFMVQFFALFYLQNCFEAFVYSGNKGKLTFSDIIEIYTRTARTYELIIPELSEPPVRTLGATFPEIESHVYR